MISTLCSFKYTSEVMGEVKVEVELESTEDRGLALRGFLNEDQIRSFKTHLRADTGAVMLVLPQDEVEALRIA